MKLTHLIHNPGAGDEEHSKKELLKTLEEAGYECRYSSTKEENWQQDLDPETDLLIVAGGDGTVGKVTRELLEQSLNKKIPIALLPLGTANNIANTLNIWGSAEEVITSWKNGFVKKFDVAKVEGLKKEENAIFLEGFGYGLFPLLMKSMMKSEEKPDTPDEELKMGLENLLELQDSYKPHHCQLTLDGEDHSGKYLMVEIMNIRSVGPNLNLAPNADPGDGQLDVVLIEEQDREQLIKYVRRKLENIEAVFPFKTIQASSIQLQWEGTHLHIDDALMKSQPEAELSITIFSDMLEFIVPQ